MLTAVAGRSRSHSQAPRRSPARLVLDVNDWHPITAEQLAGAQVGALIAKATEGTGYFAHTFAQHRHAAAVAKIPFGSYLYLDASATGDEAEWYLEHATPRSGNLQPIIDAEDLTQGVQRLAQRAATCAHRLEQRGYRPIGYGSASTILELIRHEPALARLPWWEAQYPGRFTRWTPSLARLRMRLGHHLTVVLWQWTDTLRLGRQTYDASRLFVPISRLLVP